MIEDNKETPSLTKREYFTALAMQGLCASCDKLAYYHKIDYVWEDIAKNAVIIADKTLAILDVTSKTGS